MPSFYTILKQKHWKQTSNLKQPVEIPFPIPDTLKMIEGLGSFLTPSSAKTPQSSPHSNIFKALPKPTSSILGEGENPIRSQKPKNPHTHQVVFHQNREPLFYALAPLFSPVLSSPLLKEKSNSPDKLHSQNQLSNFSVLSPLTYKNDLIPKELQDSLIAQLLNSLAQKYHKNGKIISVVEKKNIHTY